MGAISVVPAATPDSAFPWRVNAIWIERVLNLVVHSEQGVVVPAVSPHNLVLQGQMRSVLSHTNFGAFCHQFLHQTPGSVFGVWISSVVDDHDNMMHLPPSGAKGREVIEPPFLMKSLRQLVLFLGVLAGERADGAEGGM